MPCVQFIEFKTSMWNHVSGQIYEMLNPRKRWRHSYLWSQLNHFFRPSAHTVWICNFKGNNLNLEINFLFHSCATSAEAVTLNDCLQLSYLPSKRNHMLLLYPREILILDLELSQTVGVVAIERSGVPFIQVSRHTHALQILCDKELDNKEVCGNWQPKKELTQFLVEKRSLMWQLHKFHKVGLLAALRCQWVVPAVH